MAINNITPAWMLSDNIKICRQCGQKVHIEEDQSGCRDPHCPFLIEADMEFDDLDE